MFPKGFTVWLTGLSGSGKTSISQLLSQKIRALGRRVEVLDGDVLRKNLNRGLGFSKEDRDQNIRGIGFIAHLLTRNGVAVICAAISPYRAIRDENRKLIGNFIEVFVKASLETCEKRDVKGLYGKARSGEIKDFTGISDPYEEPEHPEVVCETEKETVEESVDKILDTLEKMGYLPPSGKTTNDEALHRRLKGLGYM